MKKVKDYIYKDITSVNENSTIRKVISVLKLQRIRAVPVINQLGEYIGCISEKELLSAAVPEYMKSIYNTSFMANHGQITEHLKNILEDKIINYIDTKYPSLSSEDSISYAADMMYRTQRTILPVVEKKTLVGWLTRIDILSIVLDK